jgi:hypothetical protein
MPVGIFIAAWWSDNIAGSRSDHEGTAGFTRYATVSIRCRPQGFRGSDPDEAVLLIHFIGNVTRPVLVFAEHPGDTRDGIDASAAAATFGARLGVQLWPTGQLPR